MTCQDIELGNFWKSDGWGAARGGCAQIGRRGRNVSCGQNKINASYVERRQNEHGSRRGHSKYMAGGTGQDAAMFVENGHPFSAAAVFGWGADAIGKVPYKPLFGAGRHGR